MATVKGPKGLSLNIQHDYITLKTPNGNYTTSWNGAKASGKLALDNKAFHNIDNYVETERKIRVMGDVMKSLLDPNVLSLLYPKWNDEVKQNDFVPTDEVKFIPNSLFAKHYPKGGVVVNVKRKNVFIKLGDTGEVVGFDYQNLVKI